MARKPSVAVPGLNQPFPMQMDTLPNGMQVWCQPRSDSKSVVALMSIRAGSRYETPVNNGVSHFLEHMLFTGTERWNEEEVKEIITRRGGQWNGWTGAESTIYFAHVSAEDFDIALDWLAEVVFRSTLPADKVDKERQVIFQERWGRYGWIINTLDALGFGYELDRDVRRAIFPGSTLGLRVTGEDASLERLDREALLGYYQRHYVPNNAVLIIVGSVTPERVLKRARRCFGKLERRESPTPPEMPLSARDTQRVVVRGPLPTDQVRLMIGARTVERTHPSRWALELLAEVLEQSLTEEIRYQKGLVYGLGVYNASFDDAGYFAIATDSRHEHQEAILTTVEEHLERIRCGDVAPGKVDEARAALKGRWALSMEDNLERATWLAQWATALSPDTRLPDYASALDAVTPADLSHVVTTYFIPERRYVGLHQPVVTVASGARALGGLVGLTVVAWIARKMWQHFRR